MFGIYQRLGLHVSASNRDVIRTARLKLNRIFWHDRDVRCKRHAFYRVMIGHHTAARKLHRYAVTGFHQCSKD